MPIEGNYIFVIQKEHNENILNCDKYSQCERIWFYNDNIYTISFSIKLHLININNLNIWIESHNVFENKTNSIKQTEEDNEIFTKVVKNTLGIPFFHLLRTDSDKFPGAENTYAFDTFNSISFKKIRYYY